MLKASASALWAAVASEGRRQLSARRARLGRRRPRGEFVRTVQRRVPVTARVEPGLRLGPHRAAFVDALTNALTTSGVDWFWIPQPRGLPPVVGMHVDNWATLLADVGRLAVPSWYADELDARGLPRGRWTPAGGLGRSASAPAPGLLLWDFSVPYEGSSFCAGSEGALTIWFFARGPDETLVCEVDNVVARQLPAAECAGSGGTPRSLRARPTSTVGFPVDVVYTWVDGDDDGWLRDKAEAAGEADPTAFTERAHDDARWADHDELRYSLRALEQFAPWVNHVWIVTAGQHPTWLEPDHPWVSVVSHHDIWPDERGLPTFNSHAIETCLHRIPGLAEHFVYLNDDMVIGRPVGAELFFDPGGTARFFWSRALVEHTQSREGDVASSTAARNARLLLEERYGVTFSRKFFHTGAALTVSGLTELAQLFPEAVETTRLARFRTLTDVALAGSFYLNWAYVTGRALPGPMRYTYVDPAQSDAATRLGNVARTRAFQAFCVNDGSSQETPTQREATNRLIRDFFATYLPVPGSFEIPG